MFLCKKIGPCKYLFRREKLISKCEDKLTDELEVTNMLGKIRDSHSLLKFLHNKFDQDILAVNQDRVVSLSSTGSEEDE